jgi:nitrilase
MRAPSTCPDPRRRASARSLAPQSYAPIQGDDPKTVLICGGSCIVDLLGNILVEPDFTGEAIKLAEIDRRLIARGKYDLDVVGHYARPDVFKLSVDARHKPAVEFGARPAPLIGHEPSARLSSRRKRYVRTNGA